MPGSYYCQICGGSLTVGEYDNNQEICDDCDEKLTRETVKFFKFKESHRDLKDIA